MNLKTAVAPIRNALEDRKTTVSPQEALSFLDAVVEASQRQIEQALPEDGVVLAPEPAELCRKHLDEVLEAMGRAAVQIMDAAEAIMEQDDPTPEVRAQCMNIIMSCGFQDLLGQRLMIIRRHLSGAKQGEGILTSPTDKHDAEQAESMDLGSEEGVLLQGPALDGQAMDQDAIDAMFAD